ncbi:MAG: hypothetical protein ABI648_06900 [Betaproteobacteria bacterium]
MMRGTREDHSVLIIFVTGTQHKFRSHFDLGCPCPIFGRLPRTENPALPARALNLQVGTRDGARHSHSQRVVIQLNRARLRKRSDGDALKFVDTVLDRPGFSPPVIHTVKKVGDVPLRGIIIEFKPRGCLPACY